MNYKNHPLADLFPMMEDSELLELASDIKQNGLRAKVTLFDGKILDGRNRYRACELAGVAPEFREHKNGEPLAFVISANLHRRHLSTSQRALIAASLANMPQGQPASEKKAADLPVTQEEAAKKLNVSERKVREAVKILDTAPKKQIEAIRSGEKTIHKVTEEEKVKASAKSKEKPASEDVHLDAEGRTIPPKILGLWQRAESEGKEALSIISKLRTAMRDAQEEKDLAYGEINFSSLLPELDNVYSSLKQVIPHAVCHTCQGVRPEKCSGCRGRGFFSKFFWDRCVPEEYKKLIAKKK